MFFLTIQGSAIEHVLLIAIFSVLAQLFHVLYQRVLLPLLEFLLRAGAVDALRRMSLTDSLTLMLHMCLVTSRLGILMLYETINLLLEHEEEKLHELDICSMPVYRFKSVQLDPFADLLTILVVGTISCRLNRTLLILLMIPRLWCLVVVTPCTATF